MIPKKIFLTKGLGVHKDKLAAFELALRDAGIEKYNLVYVSSILPPKCKIVSKKEGLKSLSPGEITFCVLARMETNESERLISSSVGIAIPSKEHYGYLSEYHDYGKTAKEAGEYSEDLAATMLATTLGIKFNPETAWKEREQFYKASGLIVRTKYISQSAKGKKGFWTISIAAAVMIN